MQFAGKFKTLHELADFLIRMGEVLKQMPDVNLAEVGVKSQVTYKTSKTEKTTPDKKLLDEFTVKLQHMGREEAEKRLSELTFKQLKLIARNYNIPIGERKNKKLLIRRILYNLYDFKARHELIRNFSSDKPYKIGDKVDTSTTS